MRFIVAALFVKVFNALTASSCRQVNYGTIAAMEKLARLCIPKHKEGECRFQMKPFEIRMFSNPHRRQSKTPPCRAAALLLWLC